VWRRRGADRACLNLRSDKRQKDESKDFGSGLIPFVTRKLIRRNVGRVDELPCREPRTGQRPLPKVEDGVLSNLRAPDTPPARRTLSEKSPAQYVAAPGISDSTMPVFASFAFCWVECPGFEHKL
jgi:hypothetical protein